MSIPIMLRIWVRPRFRAMTLLPLLVLAVPRPLIVLFGNGDHNHIWIALGCSSLRLPKLCLQLLLLFLWLSYNWRLWFVDHRTKIYSVATNNRPIHWHRSLVFSNILVFEGQIEVRLLRPTAFSTHSHCFLINYYYYYR